MDVSKVRFMYFRDYKGFPHITVAYMGELGEIAFNYSIFNPTDEFNKSRGRDIAKGRLLKNPKKVAVTKKELLRLTIATFILDENTSSRVETILREDYFLHDYTDMTEGALP